jgi:hypothetical protein
MATITAETVKKFLTEEMLNGPLAELVPAETLRLFLEQYVSGLFRDNLLPLQDLGAWLEGEHGAPGVTVQLFFERLQMKGQRRGILLLLPGQKTPPASLAPAGKGLAQPAEARGPAGTLQPEDIVKLTDRSVFVGMDLSGREKSLLIFLDGVRTLAQASVPTKMSVEEIGQFLKKYWSLGKFQMANPPATSAGSAAGASAAAPPAAFESTFSDGQQVKYERKGSPTAKKTAPGKAKPAFKTTAASAPVTTTKKAVAAVILAVMVLCAAWAIFVVLKMISHSHVEVHQLNAADYGAILPLSKAEQAGTAFIGTLDPGQWSKFSREQKREACEKLFHQVRSEAVSQLQLKATSGEFLALVYDEKHITILR